VPGESLVMDTTRPGNPLHFPNVCTASVPFCTSGPHVSAQKPASRPSPSPARDRAAAEVSGAGPAVLREPERRCGSFRSRSSRVSVTTPRPPRPPVQPVLPRHIGPGQNAFQAKSDKAPPCMRWRDPARPRRVSRPVSWLAGHCAPPAGARYPCEGPVSRLLSRSRGRPRGGTRFQR
jgi:hypothetical protein